MVCQKSVVFLMAKHCMEKLGVIEFVQKAFRIFGLRQPFDGLTDFLPTTIELLISSFGKL
jgi:hypothetical protein